MFMTSPARLITAHMVMLLNVGVFRFITNSFDRCISLQGMHAIDGRMFDLATARR
jgi:hypothetical protein